LGARLGARKNLPLQLCLQPDRREGRKTDICCLRWQAVIHSQS
jgi:hypothetical protein